MKKESALEEILKATPPTLIEIKAGWSGESHLMDFIIKEIEQQFREIVNVKRIDFDLHKERLNELGIKHPPAFLFVKDGQVMGIVNEILPKKILIRRIYDLLL